MQLRGATAIITGGASGLGEATVRFFFEHGARVVLLDINERRGKEIAEELGDQVIFAKADVTSESDIQRAIDLALETFGAVHVLVNCGASAPGALRRTVSRDGPYPLKEFEEYVHSYLVGTFNINRLVAVAMGRNDPTEEGERGVIINTTSISAFEGQIGQVAYAAAKAGVAGMILPIARDLAVMGIRVTAISPGVIASQRALDLPEKVKKSLISQTPFPNRMGKPREYAHLAHAIVENPMINGEIIRLDGAMRLGSK